MSAITASLEELMSPEEVAQILGVHKKTILNWINDGDLPAIHVQRTIRIAASDIAKLKKVCQ